MTFDWLIFFPVSQTFSWNFQFAHTRTVTILGLQNFEKEKKCFLFMWNRLFLDFQSNIYTNIKLVRPWDIQSIVKMAVFMSINGAYIIRTFSWLCIKESSKLTKLVPLWNFQGRRQFWIIRSSQKFQRKRQEDIWLERISKRTNPNNLWFSSWNFNSKDTQTFSSKCIALWSEMSVYLCL